MKRKILLLMTMFCCFYKTSTARIWVAGGDSKFKTIAIAIKQAKAFDTIEVQPGIYREHNLVIDKQIVLKGNGKAILDGENKYENISVKADDVVIDGFRIRNSGISGMVDFAGLKIYNRRNITVANNIFENCFFGVYVQNGSHCTIRNNTLSASQTEEQQSGNGIHCWRSDSLHIRGNTISGHRDGIYFEFVTHSIISNNHSFRNIRYGLHFMFSNNDTYTANIFEGNGSGVAVMYSNHVRMLRNFFKENWGDAAYGILLKDISDSYIEGNKFERNTIGIYMEGTSRIEMTKNIFKRNGWALKIQASCMDIDLHHNNFDGNTFDVGTNGSLVLNKFENNYWDKYEGYDLNKDKIGDTPYRPVSMYSMIIERNPPAMVLFHSLITSWLDKSEKIFPSLTPEDLKDAHPFMKPLKL